MEYIVEDIFTEAEKEEILNDDYFGRYDDDTEYYRIPKTKVLYD